MDVLVHGDSLLNIVFIPIILLYFFLSETNTKEQNQWKYIIIYNTSQKQPPCDLRPSLCHWALSQLYCFNIKNNIRQGRKKKLCGLLVKLLTAKVISPISMSALPGNQSTILLCLMMSSLKERLICSPSWRIKYFKCNFFKRNGTN